MQPYDTTYGGYHERAGIRRSLYRRSQRRACSGIYDISARSRSDPTVCSPHEGGHNRPELRLDRFTHPGGRAYPASSRVANEYDLECLFDDDLIVDAGQAVIRRVVTECVGRAIVAAGTQLEEQLEPVAVLAGDSRVKRQWSGICVTCVKFAIGIYGPDGDHITALQPHPASGQGIECGFNRWCPRCCRRRLLRQRRIRNQEEAEDHRWNEFHVFRPIRPAGLVVLPAKRMARHWP